MPPRRAIPAPPPLRHPSTNTPQITNYEQFYRTLLEPLQLYSEQPATSAPVSPRRRGQRYNPIYPDLLASHDAYIGPTSPSNLEPFSNRLNSVLTSANAPTNSDQRGLVALMEELANQSREDMRGALHPANLPAQHATHIRSLRLSYASLLNRVHEEGVVDRITSELSQEDRERFETAHELLSAESSLLNIAEPYATRLPHLG